LTLGIHEKVLLCGSLIAAHCFLLLSTRLSATSATFSLCVVPCFQSCNCKIVSVFPNSDACA